MNDFSFPPPPPPPPKPQQQQQVDNRGRGRGRGAPLGNFDQGGRNQSRGRGDHHRNGPIRGNLTTALRGHNAHRSHGLGKAAYGQSEGLARESQQDHSSQAKSSAGSSFAPNHQFSSTEYAQRPNKSLRPLASFQASQQGHGQFHAQSQSPSRTLAGHKRKLEALKDSSPKEKKAGPTTAPAIPSFGTPILPPDPNPASHTIQAGNSEHLRTKTSRRSLGLTPGPENAQYSSSDNDDDEREVDEEAAHAELGDKLTFEHNGVLMSLNSQADLAAWKKERRKNWPTAQRMAEKHRERQRIGEERKRLLAAASPPQRSSRTWERNAAPAIAEKAINGQAGSSTRQEGYEMPALPQTELEKARRDVDDRTKQLDILRKKVAASEARNRKAREEANRDESMAVKMEKREEENETAVEPTVDQDGEKGNAVLLDEEAGSRDSDESLLEESSVLSSNSSLDANSEVKPDSDDDAPEEVASKPMKAAATTNGKERPVCRYFAASGYCRDGDACPFKHERTPAQVASSWQHGQRFEQKLPQPRPSRPRMEEEQGPKKGIFERLMEQEQLEEDKLALKVIKYLGGVGFFSEQLEANGGEALV